MAIPKSTTASCKSLGMCRHAPSPRAVPAHTDSQQPLYVYVYWRSSPRRASFRFSPQDQVPAGLHDPGHSMWHPVFTVNRCKNFGLHGPHNAGHPSIIAHTYVHTYIHTYIHTHTHTHAHTQIYIYIYIYLFSMFAVLDSRVSVFCSIVLSPHGICV